MTEKEVRALSCQLGCMSRCDGSAQLGQGSTTVMVGLYGPADVKPHKEKMSGVAVDVSLFPKTGQSGVKDRSREVLIKGITSDSVMSSLHPRTGLHIGVQVLEDDGGLLSCAVNTTCLALIDAGFAMKNLFAAVTVAVTASCDIILDPDAARLRKAGVESDIAVLTFSFESRNCDVIATHMEGHCAEAKFQEALSVAKEASRSIFDFYKSVVAKKFSKENPNLT